MKLYISPGACSLASHIALCEANAKFDTEKVDLAAKKTASGGDYWAINPKGAVPALQADDGEVLTEGAVILQYIADTAKGSSLAPANGTKERRKLQEWLNFIATDVHKGFSPLFNKDVGTYKDVAKQRLARAFGYLDKQLAGKTYLMGDTFTVADAYLFTIMNWRHHMGIEIKDYPNLTAYLDRVGARPKVKEAMQAEGLKAA